MATFGSVAIRTFAHGVAALTGNQVTIEVRGRSAFTDGRAVVLPAEGIWREADFLALCGVACHEIAHVWFGSTDQLPALLRACPAGAASRVQRAFNVVMDVADETRFTRALPRADALFSCSREQVLKEAFASGVLSAEPPPAPAENQLLAVSILWTRSHARSAVRRDLVAWRRRAAALREVVSLLAKAREPKRPPAAGFKPARTVRQWRKLIELTHRLVELLDRFYPPQSGQPTGDEGSQSSQSGEDGGVNAANGADRGGEFDPMGGCAKTAMVAAAARSVAAEKAGAIPDSFDWERAAEAWCDGGLLVGGNGVEFRQDCYDRVWPAFKRAARDLGGASIMLRDDGYRSGRLSHPHRAATDGRCFSRVFWDEGPDAAVAVLFDQSGSMAGCLDVFLPVGAALADALRAAPNVQVAIWRYGTGVEMVKHTADLRHGRTLGNTATHLAIRAAAEWLNGRTAARRAVVLFTDGQPDQVNATRDAVIHLRRSGAELLVGAIGLSEMDCARSMPGGVVFNVDPSDAGCSLHVAVNRLRRMRPGPARG